MASRRGRGGDARAPAAASPSRWGKPGRPSSAPVAPPATQRSEYDRPETIEETAALVDGVGGTGIAEVVDHLDVEQVATLAARLRDRHGHVDVLVNDIWGAEILKGGPADWDRPIWELDLDKNLRLLRLAIDTHLITSHELLPLMVERPGGLLVEVTDGTDAYNASHYRISVFYDLAKVAVNRLAYSQGHELEAFGATAVALTPGWLRSEMMLEAFGATEEHWRESRRRAARLRASRSRPATSAAPSPRSRPTPTGRAGTSSRSTPGELAAEYGFTDLDGSQPQMWRFITEVREGGREADPAEYR